MVCYTIPAVAAIIHLVMRKKIPSMKNSSYHRWLNLLFLGGAIFGVVDHLWHGELFLLGEKPILDLALGIVITVTILVAWGFIVIHDKLSTKNPNKIQD